MPKIPIIFLDDEEFDIFEINVKHALKAIYNEDETSWETKEQFYESVGKLFHAKKPYSCFTISTQVYRKDTAKEKKNYPYISKNSFVELFRRFDEAYTKINDEEKRGIYLIWQEHIRYRFKHKLLEYKSATGENSFSYKRDKYLKEKSSQLTIINRDDSSLVKQKIGPLHFFQFTLWRATNINRDTTNEVQLNELYLFFGNGIFGEYLTCYFIEEKQFGTIPEWILCGRVHVMNENTLFISSYSNTNISVVVHAALNFNVSAPNNMNGKLTYASKTPSNQFKVYDIILEKVENPQNSRAGKFALNGYPYFIDDDKQVSPIVKLMYELNASPNPLDSLGIDLVQLQSGLEHLKENFHAHRNPPGFA